jgi:hypothetical protein
MSIRIHTDHLLLDDQGLTITAFGYEVSWLGGELIIERLDTGHAWKWTKEHGRWTDGDGGIVDGWVKG